MMAESVITKTVFFSVAPEVLWPYLTEREKLRLWFHPSEADLSVGEDYALVNESGDGTEKLCWGSVLSMSPPNEMEWTFSIQPLGGAMTKVLWQLEAVAGGTRLTLRHEGVEAAAAAGALGMLMALDEGWDEHFAKLRIAFAGTDEGESCNG